MCTSFYVSFSTDGFSIVFGGDTASCRSIRRRRRQHAKGSHLSSASQKCSRGTCTCVFFSVYIIADVVAAVAANVMMAQRYVVPCVRW